MKSSRIKQFFKLNLLKTIYINYRMLPINEAIKLPILINYRTELVNLSGEIRFSCPVRTGMIQFNNHNDEFIGNHHWRRIEIKGKVTFGGKVDFGIGSVLFVRKGGCLYLGDNIIIGGGTRILCEERITIGNNVRLAHESQLMDSNFHYIRNLVDGSVEKCISPVIIGNNNWIGNRSTIMKGTATPDFLIVGSNSLLNKDYTKTIDSYSIIGGAPAKLIKKGYERIFDLNIESKYDECFNRIL